MSDDLTITASEFKAKCLDILDQLSTRKLKHVTVTKRGRVVAVLSPPLDPADAVKKLHGFLKGSVIIPDGLDLTAPTLVEPIDAEQGLLHN